MRDRHKKVMSACAACVFAAMLAAGVSARQPAAPPPAEVSGDRVIKLFTEGRYAEATVMAERLVALAEKESADETQLARACYVLASLYSNQSLYEQAVQTFERALGIYKKLGNSLEAAMVLNNLAMLYVEQANYKRAIPLSQEAVEIFERKTGEASPETITARNNLATAYYQQGDQAKAIPIFQHCLKVQEQALGKEHPDTTTTLGNLGVAFSDQGDDRRALEYHLRALKIREKAGLENPDLAQALFNVASKYVDDDGHERARPLLERALKIYERSVGPKHHDVAKVLDKLAEVHFVLDKDVDRAASEIRRALELRTEVLGEAHPDTARSLLALAAIYYFQDGQNYERALPLIRRAISVHESALGTEHPDLMKALTGLSDIYSYRGDYDDSIKLLQRSSEIEEKHLALILNIGSQRQKQQYLQATLYQTNVRVFFNVRKVPRNAEAARMAFTAVLRYKRRGLDAFANQIENLRRNATPEARQLLNQLTEVQSELAGLLISGAGARAPDVRRARVALLKDEEERLEDAISRRSAEFRAGARTITIDAVRRVLPSDAALVEFFFYVPYKLSGLQREYSTPHYVAYVLRPQDDTPRFVDLGEMPSLHAELTKFRDLLRTPKSSTAQVSALARGLDERLMRPVRELLGPTRRVFLAPEGSLNILPFGALMDENGQYLVENYSLNYLSSGRDLLNFQGEDRPDAGAAAIMANPHFDLTRPFVTCGSALREFGPPRDAPDSQAADLTGYFMRLCYPTLKGSAQEAEQIRTLLPGALVLTRQDATEAALKALRRPRVLHIATHGFFTDDRPAEMLEGRELVWESRNRAPRNESPLLRSGLVLAGVKQGRSGPGNDGVLTALEAASLDLFGTKLVVLSACETGLGDVTSGEGVYGLRRALVLAGSETQVMSLWNVSDNVTRDLMVAYYRRLQAGEGRAEAMRAVQLSMLKGGSKVGATTDVRHPYYWAAFIQSGDWRSMRPGTEAR